MGCVNCLVQKVLVDEEISGCATLQVTHSSPYWECRPTYHAHVIAVSTAVSHHGAIDAGT